VTERWGTLAASPGGPCAGTRQPGLGPYRDRPDTTAIKDAKGLIRAPSDGTVALLVAEPGEAIVPGQPLISHAPGLRWASSNSREDPTICE